MSRIPLPIDSFLPKILERIRPVPALLLQASPGSGKTTRVPPALVDQAEDWVRGREIWILEPRRLAAKMAALRVAEERGEDIGQTVGYHFRQERIQGPHTKILYLTEGMLLRLLPRNPGMMQVAAVILDEFHERRLNTDVALAVLRQLQKTRRPDLKLIVMSATLETEALQNYLDQPPLIRLEAQRHPVSIDHLPLPSSERLEEQVRKAVASLLAETVGDLLVFLPGMAEIRRVEERLAAAYGSQVTLIPLHGGLSREEQALAFSKSPRRKIILATNIAETSLTFEGVGAVIDSGLHRQARFSHSKSSGFPTLKTRPVSKASAVQRAGRAGRTGPGRCLRLYTQSDFEGRPNFDAPEIRRSDLSQTLLELKNLGIASPKDLSWLEPPDRAALEAAERLLFRLNAVSSEDAAAPLTESGRRMAGLPLHPRFARMLLEAEGRGVLEEAAWLAALITEDRLDNLEILQALETIKPDEALRRSVSQILSAFGKKSARSRFDMTPGREKNLARSLLAGFADRVAQKRPDTRGAEMELVFCQGGAARVARSAVMDRHDFFVILDVQETQKTGQSASTRVRSLCPIAADWLLDLSHDLLQETSELVWEADKHRVMRLSRLNYGELVLTESRETPAPDPLVTRFFLKELGFNLSEEGSRRLNAGDVLKVFEHFGDSEPLEEFFARAELLSQHDPSLPALSGLNLLEFLLNSLSDANLTHIDTADLAQRFHSHLPDKAKARLHTVLPLAIKLPSGRQTKIHYRLGQKPWIASRLQDFFGISQGPSVMNGKVPLLIHLLAPNQRPVQVTQDLQSFWKNTYPKLRKELSRKYPRHKWPEDPLEWPRPACGGSVDVRPREPSTGGRPMGRTKDAKTFRKMID